jgi:hypothetical protein
MESLTDAEKKAAGLKKVGLFFDDYKLQKAENLLKKEGFTEYIKSPFTPGVTGVFVWVTPDKVKKLHALCATVQAHFQRSN